MKHVSVGVIYSGEERLFVEAISRSLGGSGIELTWSADDDDLTITPELPEEALACNVLLVLSTCRPEVLEAAIEARRGGSQVKPVAVLAMERNGELLEAVRQSGANAYLSADMSLEAFRECVHLVALGVEIFPASPPVAEPASTPMANGAPGVLAAPLSLRELEVVTALGHGLSNKAIARKLRITESTVKTHLKAILRKTGAANRTQVAIWAIANKIAQPAVKPAVQSP